MSPWRIAWKGLRSRALSSSIAVGSLGLSACLLLLVWGFKSEAERSFAEADGGFDAVLGARGSKLQLVLNALYHLEDSPGLIRWEDYEQIKGHPAVEAAYPIAVGDNYLGYRLVGTEPEYLTEHRFRGGEGFVFRGTGRVFGAEALEAVAGSVAARQLGLAEGDEFSPYCGLIFNPNERHEEVYVVTGVLEPTGTPADRVIWIPVKGVQTMSGHSAEAATSVSAALVKLRPGANMAGFQLDMLYNRRGDRLTFAWPASQSILSFFDKLGWFSRALEAVVGLVALIAAAGVTAVLYNAMNERRRDIAVWRALGARRRTVFAVALLEALGIAGAGLAAGFALYFSVGYGLAAYLRVEAGIALDLLSFTWAYVWVPVGLLGVGALAGLLPAAKAYRTVVSENLT